MAEQESRVPTRKVLAASLGSAVSVIAIYLVEAEFSFAIDLPDAVEVAVATLFTFAVGYYVPPSTRDQIIS